MGAVRSCFVVCAFGLVLGGVAGCRALSGQPCGGGGRQCPTGYSCEDARCEPVGLGGEFLTVRAEPPRGSQASDFTEYSLDVFMGLDGLSCRFYRDPVMASEQPLPAPQVARELPREGEARLYLPTGRLVLVVSGFRDGVLVARACRETYLSAGYPHRETLHLFRLETECGDGVLDFGEQCDPGEDGAFQCNEECISLPSTVTEAESGRCLENPAVACTEQRCLVGWIDRGPADETLAAVEVRAFSLQGEPDPERNRGSHFEAAQVSSLALASRGDQAAALWTKNGNQHQVAFYNVVGQQMSELRVSTDIADPVLIRARFRSPESDDADGSQVEAVWVNANGAVVRGVVPSGAAPSQHDIGFPLGDSLSGAFFGEGVTLAWAEESFSHDEDGAVVGLSLAWTGDEPASDARFLVSDSSAYRQKEPFVAAVPYGSRLLVWADSDNSLDDRSEFGIRARLSTSDGPGQSFAINSTTAGTQEAPVAAAGGEFYVVAWLDRLGTEKIRARYFSGSRALGVSFGEGETRDFLVHDGGGARLSGLTVLVGHSVLFLWLEGAVDTCPGGGTRLMMRLLPPPVTL